MISAGSLRQQRVLNSHMAYIDSGGSGPAILFLHGNPTSSFIWRDIMPHVAPLARVIAPDLIGFGRSGKPAIEYRFQDHVRYLDAFIDALGLDDIFLVAQDWGTALAFHLARRRPQIVRGLAFMEFIHPMASWADFHQSDMAREIFGKFRTPGIGPQLILEDNLFIERILPGSIMRTLSPAEMEAYRAPFPTPESRLPIWRLPNELPIGGDPADVAAIVAADHAALIAGDYPKLLFSADPGALISPAYARAFAAKTLHCRHIELGAGRHYLQEDHPHAIGQALAGWVAALLPEPVRRRA